MKSLTKLTLKTINEIEQRFPTAEFRKCELQECGYGSNRIDQASFKLEIAETDNVSCETQYYEITVKYYWREGNYDMVVSEPIKC